MNPKLSIIIPFYGTASKGLLDRCTASIHSQGMEKSNYEVILTDDGGLGVYAARNNGISQAQGEYILFMDADDYLFPDTLLPCFSILQEQAPDILSFDFLRVKEKDQTIPSRSIPQETRYSSGAEYMANNNFFGVIWRYFIRRELIVKENLSFCLRTHHQDEIFTAQAYFLAHTVIHFPLIVYAYYQRNNSLVHHQGASQRKERIADFYNILTTLQQFGVSHPNASSLQQESLNRRIHFLTIDYLRQLIRNRCSASFFHQQVQTMTKGGLLPLPNKKYSMKYTLACSCVNFYLSIIHPERS